MELKEFWAESILRRVNFVKRKGTKAAKKLPENFGEIKAAFLERIATSVRKTTSPKNW